VVGSNPDTSWDTERKEVGFLFKQNMNAVTGRKKYLFLWWLKTAAVNSAFYNSAFSLFTGFIYKYQRTTWIL